MPAYQFSVPSIAWAVALHTLPKPPNLQMISRLSVSQFLNIFFLTSQIATMSEYQQRGISTRALLLSS